MVLLRSELAPHNITVNSIHPGILATDLHSAVVAQFSNLQGRWSRSSRRLGSGAALYRFVRLQTPKDIGEMAAFLASDGEKTSPAPPSIRRRGGNALSGGDHRGVGRTGIAERSSGGERRACVYRARGKAWAALCFRSSSLIAPQAPAAAA